MNVPFKIKYSLFGSDRFAFLMILLFPITLLNVLFQSFVPYHLYLSGAYFIGLMMFIFYYYPKTTLTLTFMVTDFYENTWKQYQFKVKWGDRLTWMHYVHPQIESFHIEGHYIDQACTHRVDPKMVGFVKQDMIVFTKWKEDNHQATFMLDENNQFMATGCNDFGQLGNGILLSTLKPITIDFNLLKENEKIVKYWLGFSYVGFVLTNFGRVLAWGRNYFGEIGDNSHLPCIQAKCISFGEEKQVAHISPGYGYVLSITNQGEVFAWGANTFGQLGDGSVNERKVPKIIEFKKLEQQETIKQVSAGGWHSLALSNLGHVYAWGWNEDGQVGDGTETQRKTPKIIEFKKLEQQETMIEISAGGWHSLALSNLGFVYAWGYNKDGRLGNYKNINQNVPKKIKFHHLKKSERIVKIKAGFYHNIAMTSLGNLYAWGSNEHGQIGDGTTLNRNHPVKVKLNGMDDSEYVVSFDVYKYHSVFKTNHNHFYACGLNQYGQLGDGTKTNRLQPTLVRLSFQENN